MLRRLHKKEFNELESKVDVPMVILTMLLLCIIAFRETKFATPTILSFLNFTDYMIYIVFVFELVIMTYLSPDRRLYLTTHWVNILIVFFPFLRFMRLFSLVDIIGFNAFMSMVRTDSIIIRVGLLLMKAIADVKELLLSRKFIYIFPIVLFLVAFLGSLASIYESKSPNANIINPYEGIWWGITSITTVGYGDRFPVTWPGRFIGIVFMTLGITLFSILTANISSYFIGRHEDEDTKKILEKLDELEKRIEKR